MNLKRKYSFLDECIGWILIGCGRGGVSSSWVMISRETDAYKTRFISEIELLTVHRNG